jgi:hypothetical protein
MPEEEGRQRLLRGNPKAKEPAAKNRHEMRVESRRRASRICTAPFTPCNVQSADLFDVTRDNGTVVLKIRSAC